MPLIQATINNFNPNFWVTLYVTVKTTICKLPAPAQPRLPLF